MASAVGAASAGVIIWGRNQAKNDAALERLTAEGVSAHAVTSDVADSWAIADAFERSVALAGGRIDSVFANAAVSGVGTPFLGLGFRRVAARDVGQPRRRVPHAAGRGASHARDRRRITRGGLLHVGDPRAAGNEACGTSKTTLLGLVRALAVALVRHRIRVLPGWTLTELTTDGYENDRFRQVTTARTTVRRSADPSEMGPATVFLADPSTVFHTGDSIVVDGGYTIK